MNRICYWPIGATLAVALLAGCSGGGANGYVPTKPPALSAATVQPGQEATYFPFAVDDQWTYEATSRTVINGRVFNGGAQITYRLKKLTPSPDGGQDATFDILDDKNKVSSHEIWRVDQHGIYSVGSGKTAIHMTTPPSWSCLSPSPSTPSLIGRER